ncbi:MAG TPA: ribosomal protein S18-alanine N-acetyltransferase [Gemmatimonadales bacterium]|nr:ribosomal protein S18-alanine N-acetyltransferase [Gemmatimonadales bacterium]
MHAIETAAFADPWSRRDFADALGAHVPFLVAIEDGRAVGYVLARQAADEAEILNLGVAPTARRRGIGRALVREGLAALAARGAEQVFLEVRESNAAARALYAEFGFAEVGRRRGYYRRPTEDAIVLRAAISAAGGSA